MATLSNLYLFIHAMPRRRQTREEYLTKWQELIAAAGPDEHNVICILSSGGADMAPLVEPARAHFGERCILDPDDDSVETKVLLADDLQRTFGGRGTHTEWIPYEIWTAKNARRWTEGLKKELSTRGYTYEPDSLHLVTCGQQWGGCLSKYSSFMATYLGLTRAPDLRADLSPDAGYPVKARFVERVEMARHVYLFLFELPDGRPMAQFTDGLRAVWEPPHVAEVAIDPAKVEVFTTSPNSYVKTCGSAKVTEDGVVADVGDGCHPAMTTLIGLAPGFDEFRASLAKAAIRPRDDRCRLAYSARCMDPVTSSWVTE